MTEFKNLRFGPMPRMLPLSGTVREVRLLDQLDVFWDDGGLSVPKGFCHDGPSIPNRLRGIVFYTHKLLKPSIVHDWLYVEQPKDWTRKRADEFFLEALKVEGVGAVRRNIMYRAVRVGGGRWKN